MYMLLHFFSCTNFMETKKIQSRATSKQKVKEQKNDPTTSLDLPLWWYFGTRSYNIYIFFKGKWICCDFLCVCSSFQWGSFNSTSFAQFFTILNLFHTYICWANCLLEHWNAHFVQSLNWKQPTWKTSTNNNNSKFK